MEFVVLQKVEYINMFITFELLKLCEGCNLYAILQRISCSDSMRAGASENVTAEIRIV